MAAVPTVRQRQAAAYKSPAVFSNGVWRVETPMTVLRYIFGGAIS